MLKGLLGRVVGDSNDREIRKLQPLVEAINALEPQYERRTNAELRGLTDQFRARLAAGSKLDDILVEAFAAAREASKRTVAMRPFDVQLIGAIVLHQGKVAEMKTGEGKTLVATLPIYLNALAGEGVHLVTVNDYLARRDTLWMGPIYHLLGLSVGLLQQGADQPAYLFDPSYQREPYPGLRPVPRRAAYAADITYGTNNEFGFDYLRDNLALSLSSRVQRSLHFAIVDEVDNIFIDEARTPLIISGPSDEPVEEYTRFAAIARQLEPGVHFELDEKERSVYLTDDGLAVVERETGIENLYDEANYRYVHYMEQALKAQVLYQEGRDYIRQRKRIILIDPHTGRLMPNRRLSEGLHQAIEAKEGVPILPRDVTSATITIQNYFRMYKKLAGMSGTAVTEAEEFYKIYSLDVLPIPTNRPMIRVDHPDVVYRTEEAKLRAVARELLACHSQGQPVLVGTTSVEMSERLSARLSAERLQMAALAPRLAYALQEADLDREGRARLRELLNTSLESVPAGAWRKLARDLNVDGSALSSENLDWIADYLQLPNSDEVRQGLARALREGIPHQVLNAKEHTREAGIIARAGEPGAVTIATNMAGRGVDIRLGGELTAEVINRAHQALRARGLDPFGATAAQMDSAIAEVAPQYAKRRDQVLAVGGLHILGTERHEARRIDNQLRGRSGRQGEPGSSRFYLSLEDDLMRRFGRKEMLSKLMEQIGDDTPIEHSLVSKTIERAQASVEGYNFDIRKHLLEYDDVLNRQRDSIYSERLRILRAEDLRDDTLRMLEAQIGEYSKASQEPDQQRLMFAGLDEALPLLLLAPSSPFRGPLPFGGHLTAFPPFTISLLADRLAGQPLDAVQEALRDLPRHAALAYGDQMRKSIGDMFRATSDKYEESLERYKSLLDEKIDDYVQLAEEREEGLDLRRLAQHLERTYPLKLTTARQSGSSNLEDLKKQWQAQIEDEYHRLTCRTLMERTRSRLPLEAAAGLERIRPCRLTDRTLASELERVQELALRQPHSSEASGQRAGSQSSAPSTSQLLEQLALIKDSSDLDFGRLDRLVAHVLGAQLDDLIAGFQAASSSSGASKVGEGQASRLRGDLERLREALLEGKRGGRSDLLSLLQQLNDLVHLELDDLEELLQVAAGHEYDKWAQRQVTELEGELARNPLSDTSWHAIAECLLATHYTQKQVYDREHRRQVAWLPRLNLSFVAQAATNGLSPEELRSAVLDTLVGAIHLREQTWGEQELQRWSRYSLSDLDDAAHDALLRFVGASEIAEHREGTVGELPADLYEDLRFVVALDQLRSQPLGAYPQADDLLSELDEGLQTELLETPIGGLDPALQQRIEDRLRRAGLLESAEARTRLLEQPIQSWERRTREQVAGYLGAQFVADHGQETLSQLDPEARDLILDYLRRQRRFVDEERVQRFLVRQGLQDLPAEVRQSALQHLARARLEQLGKRKISNLDLMTRQQVLESIQRMGLLTDTERRSEITSRSLAELEPSVQAGFGDFLADRIWNAAHTLRDLGDPLRSHVLEQLEVAGALDDPERVQALPGWKLGDLEGPLGSTIAAEMVGQLRAELEAKTMEELPPETREAIHHELVQHDYFVDAEKVSWFERKTLAQLPPDLLRGLEQHLGRIRLLELLNVRFRDLPAESQTALLTAFDAAGILGERAERLRLTQSGTLADLSSRDRELLLPQLGRQWLVQIRDRRPAALPERERQAVWDYLRAQGYFTDEFKEELFAYQRLDEFGPLAEPIRRTLNEELASRLSQTPLGALPANLQASILTELKKAGFLRSPERARWAEELPPTQLPADLRAGVAKQIGAFLLEQPAGLKALAPSSSAPPGASLLHLPIGQWPTPVQDLLWQYLDQVGYFLDEGKRAQFLERRLSDLSSDVVEAICHDLAQRLEAQIGETPISELDPDLRQGLRQALEVQGYFESPTAYSQVQEQPLNALARTDLDALAVELGEVRIAAWANQSLSQLPAEERQGILDHLQSLDWFVDRSRLEQLKGQSLRDLAAGLPRDFVAELSHEQVERLRQSRLADLDRAQRHIAFEALYAGGLRADEGVMRPWRARPVRELREAVYSDLLRYLGSKVVTRWPSGPIRDMPAEAQVKMAAFLGRRIMSRIEQRVLLYTISRLWIDYLTDIEDLRRGIGLEAFGQRDPLVEYKRKAFELFEELADNIRRTVVRSLFRQHPEPLATPGG